MNNAVCILPSKVPKKCSLNRQGPLYIADPLMTTIQDTVPVQHPQTVENKNNCSQKGSFDNFFSSLTVPVTVRYTSRCPAFEQTLIQFALCKIAESGMRRCGSGPVSSSSWGLFVIQLLGVFTCSELLSDYGTTVWAIYHPNLSHSLTSLVQPENKICLVIVAVICPAESRSITHWVNIDEYRGSISTGKFRSRELACGKVKSD